jgi:hypothetical protein
MKLFGIKIGQFELSRLSRDSWKIAVTFIDKKTIIIPKIIPPINKTPAHSSPIKKQEKLPFQTT